MSTRRLEATARGMTDAHAVVIRASEPYSTLDDDDGTYTITRVEMDRRDAGLPHISAAVEAVLATATAAA